MSEPAAPPSRLDLSSCAREPIHTPGAIQPYGVLLVVHPGTLQVVERAVSLPSMLAAFGDPLDHTVAQVLGGVLAPFLPHLEQMRPGASAFLGGVYLDGHGRHQLLAHRSTTHLLLELESPVHGEPGSLEDLYPALRRFMAAIEKAASTRELCELASVHVRALCGFDRALVYQFDKGFNGTVVAEDRNDVLPSYLDLRFPESDIPAQARELYRRNRVRLIADSDYQPVALQRSAAMAGSAPTDLSLASLRSVSPVHLQYMRNMGTGASMSVSLLNEGRLWGLVSCHSQQPRRVPYHVRTACEFIGQILSLQIALKERALAVEERVARRATLVKLLGRMAGTEDFMAALGRDSASLLALANATGAAIVHRGDCVLLGQAPSQAQVMALVHWMAGSGQGHELLATDHLSQLWPQADAFADVASGLLAVSISQLHDSFLMWFRPEVVRTVRWGGDPRKAPSAGQPLSPRMSFEAWKETVHQRSLPWEPEDRDAALEMRTAIVDIVLRKAEEMAELNEQLLRSNKELEAFSYSVSHDLRAPFRHIVGYSELLGSSAADRLTATEKRFLDTIVESAKSAGTLVDDLLSFSQMGRSAIGRAQVDCATLVEDVRRSLDMEYTGRAITWRMAPLPSVDADPAMLRLVWQNLLSNAVKFTRDQPDAVIEVGHERAGDEDVFFVRDNGCGFDMRYVDKLFGVFQRLHHVEEFEGTGIGLANVHRIIARHGGRTWAEGEVGKGATLHFSLPLFSGEGP
ncbi:ATP-binding protein [Stenotrophomonas sp. 24(2023)]|uniref:ATP-binding protein n=1 Tax=Stenotrophomonas sp. 24(2023) TaxID=3068324 RepID=UPI0027E0A1CD|nr:ATP-binding protein [Stenotrophomonas sp. 24(2023)]WMJ69303.1 GAF domain-containing protein [Stenotrophomonas sp. 24(2023)]